MLEHDSKVVGTVILWEDHKENLQQSLSFSCAVK